MWCCNGLTLVIQKQFGGKKKPHGEIRYKESSTQNLVRKSPCETWVMFLNGGTSKKYVAKITSAGV
jgi:hypothetical protein